MREDIHQDKLMSLIGSKILIGSRNVHKRQPLIDTLAPYGFELIMAENTNVANPKETGTTFLENALIKARAYSQGSGLPTLADDSGLVIPALNGAPGIHSARFAATHGGYDTAFKVLQKSLTSLDTRACLTSTLIFMWPEGPYLSAVGECWGTLVFPASDKDKGFGYTPIFQPDGSDMTISQMSAEEILSLSHRIKAITSLLKQLFDPEILMAIKAKKA